MATIDALPILKQNIIALNKCPAHYRNLWRFAVTEVNQAGQSSDPIIRKGAEITLALLPNMLLRAPSTEERLLRTGQKMDSRFAKFFAGDFDGLISDIPQSSVRAYEQNGLRPPRTHIDQPEIQEERAIHRAESLAKEGLISRAVSSLESSPPAPATLQTFQELQDLHPNPTEPLRSAIPPNSPRNSHTPSDKALYSAIRNAPNRIRSGPTNWSYEMLKNAMTTDPSTYISAFKDILLKFCNTPDGVNMVILMIQDTLRQNADHSATTVDSRNAFNSASRQKILDLVYATFPQLAHFVETWYLTPSPLWFYMLDHTIGTIMSREGVQQGDVIASFLFTLLYAPVLLNIFNRIHALCSSVQLFAILDDITFTGPAHLSEEMFKICSQELALSTS